MIKHLLLLAMLASFLFGCRPSRSLIPVSSAESDLNHYIDRLSGAKKKAKHLQGLESAFQQAQVFDLALMDSLLEENRPDLWPLVNALHRRLQARQAKVAALEPLRAKDGYAPTLHFVTNIGEREAESRRQAANYLYNKAERLLSESVEMNNPPAARQAFYTLQDLKRNYFPYWDNANAMYDEALQLGITNVLLVNLPASKAVESRAFWRTVSAQIRYLDDEWHVYQDNLRPDQAYDYTVECRLENLYVDSESRSESSYTEEKDIETGYEEKKDTAGHVLERIPIYEHVKAEIRELTLSKQAYGTLSVLIRNVHSDAVLFAVNLPGGYNYRENFTFVSGDSRALKSSVMTSPNPFPTAPADFTMSDHVIDDLRAALFSFLKKNLAAY